MSRKESWARYDAKRKGKLDRLLKERERKRTGRLLRGKKIGRCAYCGWKVSTVWHHVTYVGTPPLVVELCHKCHRMQHPRPLPQGGTA